MYIHLMEILVYTFMASTQTENTINNAFDLQHVQI